MQLSRPPGPTSRGRLLAPARLTAALLLLAATLGPAGPAAAQQQQQQQQQQQRQQAAPPPPQQQPQRPPGGGGGGGGGGEPVEIVADSLTVEQERQLATFTGNVDAVQGDLRLRADKLLVHYDQGGDAPAGRQQPQAAQGGEQSIRRLEAVGNVFVTQPGETAKGDRGTYEPGSGAMTLEGNVVLTREQNVIRGARLESNQRTGVSTVFAAAPGAARKPDQRVRALFVQGGGGPPAAAPAAAAPAAATAPAAAAPAARTAP